MKYVNKIKINVLRNRYCRDGKKAKKHKVNLEYYSDETNLGDALAPIIFNWMLERKGISSNSYTRKTYHLLTVGSIIGGRGSFDAVIWGSGVRSFSAIHTIGNRRRFQNLDIRAVRGPITRQVLCDFGYLCPEIYGDPGVLMPLVYKPAQIKTEREKIGLIQHFHSEEIQSEEVMCIDVRTNDYKSFVNQLMSCNKVISSSLHGIILAESYGIPAVFLGKDREEEMIKYFDWYHSTGRYDVKVAFTLEEALAMEPMKIPNIRLLQDNLINSFPYDLWKG